MRRYTGQEVVRKGWRMQDKRAVPGCSDCYVHDEDGPWPHVPEHDQLCNTVLAGKLVRGLPIRHGKTKESLCAGTNWSVK
jgi:hypothetical protein